MPRKTQLADEIADLLNPAPTAEQGDDDEFVSSSQKPLGLLADDDVALEPSRSGGRRMRAAIDMSATGSKYAGRVISRDSLDRRRRLPSHPEPSGVDDDDSGEAEEDDGDEVEDDGDSAASSNSRSPAHSGGTLSIFHNVFRFAWSFWNAAN